MCLWHITKLGQIVVNDSFNKICISFSFFKVSNLVPKDDSQNLNICKRRFDMCSEYPGSSFDDCIYDWINQQAEELYNCSIFKQTSQTSQTSQPCQLDSQSISSNKHILDTIKGTHNFWCYCRFFSNKILYELWSGYSDRIKMCFILSET